MNTHSSEERAELLRIAAQFVDAYTRHCGVTRLDEDQADDITDDFHVMVMDQFVNPFAEPAEER